MQLMMVAFLLFLTSIIRGQLNIVNQSLTDSSVNIFYVGVDNHINLKNNKNLPGYLLSTEGAGSSIVKISATEYIVRVNKIDTCKVIVGKNGKEVLSKIYRSDVLAAAFAGLNGLCNATVSKSKIFINPFLKVVMPGSYYRHNLHVLSFSAAFIQEGDTTFTYTAGYLLTREQLKLIHQLNPGDSISFSNIRVNCCCGRITLAPSFWIKIE